MFCEALGLIQRFLNLQVAFPVQVDSLHVGNAIIICGRQQEQISREEAVFLNFNDFSYLHKSPMNGTYRGFKGHLTQD